MYLTRLPRIQRKFNSADIPVCRKKVVGEETRTRKRARLDDQLLRNPFSEEKKEFAKDLWSDEEKLIFKKRFVRYGKDFSEIASSLDEKNTKDCVKYYYLTKMDERKLKRNSQNELESLRKQLQESETSRECWEESAKKLQLQLNISGVELDKVRAALGELEGKEKESDQLLKEEKRERAKANEERDTARKELQDEKTNVLSLTMKLEEMREQLEKAKRAAEPELEKLQNGTNYGSGVAAEETMPIVVDQTEMSEADQKGENERRSGSSAFDEADKAMSKKQRQQRKSECRIRSFAGRNDRLADRSLHCFYLVKKFGKKSGKIRCQLCSEKIQTLRSNGNVDSTHAITHALRHLEEPIFHCRLCKRTESARLPLIWHINKFHEGSSDGQIDDRSDDFQQEILDVLSKCYDASAVGEA